MLALFLIPVVLNNTYDISHLHRVNNICCLLEPYNCWEVSGTAAEFHKKPRKHSASAQLQGWRFSAASSRAWSFERRFGSLFASPTGRSPGGKRRLLPIRCTVWAEFSPAGLRGFQTARGYPLSRRCLTIRNS